MGFTVDTSNRLTGLASGLDTEQMVKDLMKGEAIRLDKLEQQKQLLTWKQEGYREVTESLKDFESKYLNLTNPSTNFLSSGAYNARSATCSSNDYVTAVADPGSSIGTMTITDGSMARVASVQGATGLTSPLFGTVDITTGAPINVNGKGLVVSVDGTEREITFDQDYANYTDFLVDFQGKLDNAFGEGRVTTGITSEGHIGLTDANSTIAVFSPDSTPDALGDLGLVDGQSYRIDINSTLSTLSGIGLTFDINDEVTFEINGESFAFSKDATIQQMMDGINRSDAGVTMRYDAINDGFVINSKEVGGSQSVNIANQSGNLFGGSSVIGIDNGSWYGANAELAVDGQLLTSENNTFKLDGVTYTLNKDFAVGQSATVSVTNDDEKVIENIKSFVNAYNDLINGINSKLNEKRNFDYDPLTDAQKEEMSDDEIEKWQMLAKSGMLRSDDVLRGVTQRLRTAMMSTVEGAGAGDPDVLLASIGITTGHYSEQGQLHIDETKLRNALAERRDEVVQLFSGKSDIAYTRDLTKSECDDRFKDSGLAWRVSDIIKDFTTGLRNASGKKGILLEKAGWDGDGTDTDNVMSDRIEDVDDKITAAEAYLKKREQYYWRQFNALENAMQRMNAQSSWISQQMGVQGG